MPARLSCLRRPEGGRPGPRAALAALLIAVVALGGIGGAAARSAPGPIALSEYIARLDRARQLADADVARPSARAMSTLRAALGLPVDVQVAGAIVHIPSDPVLSGSSADDFVAAGDHLGAMEDAAKAALGAPTPDRGQIASALAAAYAGITPRPNLFTRVRHDLWAAVLSVWHSIRGLADRVPLPHGLLAILAAAALLVVVVFVVRRTSGIVPETGAGERVGWGQRRSHPVDWDRLAEEARARGDLDAAVRARYNALLAALAGRGVIPQAPSLTAGECRRAVATNLPSAYPVVARATAIFESTAYGRAPADRGEVDALKDAETTVSAA